MCGLQSRIPLPLVHPQYFHFTCPPQSWNSPPIICDINYQNLKLFQYMAIGEEFQCSTGRYIRRKVTYQNVFATHIATLATSFTHQPLVCTHVSRPLACYRTFVAFMYHTIARNISVVHTTQGHTTYMDVWTLSRYWQVTNRQLLFNYDTDRILIGSDGHLRTDHKVPGGCYRKVRDSMYWIEEA
jgi:hypothetical protein